MRCRSFNLVLPVLAVLAVPALAAAGTVVCPDPIHVGTDDRSYEAGPATDCVYGTGNIVGGNVGDSNEDFLNGNGTNDGGGSATLGGNWTGLGSNDPKAITGLTITPGNGSNSGTFTLDTSQFTFTQFALGIVDGGTPKWAVFLLDMSAAVNGILTGTWDIDGYDKDGNLNEDAGALSHVALYGRNGGSTGQVLPEPATMAMFGFGLIAVAYRARRRSKLN